MSIQVSTISIDIVYFEPGNTAGGLPPAVGSSPQACSTYTVLHSK